MAERTTSRVEGACLGGQVVAQVVERRLALTLVDVAAATIRALTAWADRRGVLS